jgi:hypothetical protein
MLKSPDVISSKLPFEFSTVVSVGGNPELQLFGILAGAGYEA